MFFRDFLNVTLCRFLLGIFFSKFYNNTFRNPQHPNKPHLDNENSEAATVTGIWSENHKRQTTVDAVASPLFLIYGGSQRGAKDASSVRISKRSRTWPRQKPAEFHSSKHKSGRECGKIGLISQQLQLQNVVISRAYRYNKKRREKLCEERSQTNQSTYAKLFSRIYYEKNIKFKLVKKKF